MFITEQSANPEQPTVTDEPNAATQQSNSKVKVDRNARFHRTRKSIFLPFFPLRINHVRDHLSLSLLTPRTRRFSCSSNSNGASSGLVSPGPRLAPRVSQLRQEECVDVHNREATHEREVHSALSISQSYEDLTLVLSENWSFKNSEEFSNPLHVTLPNSNVCSSPSPTR